MMDRELYVRSNRRKDMEEMVDIHTWRLDEKTLKSTIGKNLVLLSNSKEATAGVISLKPKQRVPEKGFSSHDAVEICLLLKGTVVLNTEHNRKIAVEGDMAYIPRSTPHFTLNESAEEEAKIFWVLAPAVKL